MTDKEFYGLRQVLKQRAGRKRNTKGASGRSKGSNRNHRRQEQDQSGLPWGVKMFPGRKLGLGT